VTDQEQQSMEDAALQLDAQTRRLIADYNRATLRADIKTYVLGFISAAVMFALLTAAVALVLSC
jgi:hypothetical protein